MKRLIVLLIVVMCGVSAYATSWDARTGIQVEDVTDKSYYTDEVCEICRKGLEKWHEGNSYYGTITNTGSCYISIDDVENPNYLQSREICLCDDCYKRYKPSFKEIIDKWLKGKQEWRKEDRERNEKQRTIKKKKDARTEIEKKIEELTKLLKQLKKEK